MGLVDGAPKTKAGLRRLATDGTPLEMSKDSTLDQLSVVVVDRVQLAASLTEESDEVLKVEESLKRNTGRPRSLSVKAILTALLLLALDDRPLILKSVTELLYFQLTQEQTERLGVVGRPTSHRQFLALYKRVRYMFHLSCNEVDPSPLPKNLCIENEMLLAMAKSLSESASADKATSLLRLCNSLLDQSVKPMSEDELKSYDGQVSLDATVVPLFSRGPSKTKGTCASDPDGGWYIREGDHRDSEDNKGRRRTKIAWALEATIATIAQIKADGSHSGVGFGHPNLVLGFQMSRPGADPGGMG